MTQLTRPDNAYFLTGTHTDIGKTVVASIFTQAWSANYWKPIQAGDEFATDSQRVEELAPGAKRIWPERYKLKAPMSPHAAADRENVAIQLNDFELPQPGGPLIVEGAGGLLVPINHQATILDLMEQLALPVILVSRHYLGSINHTLSSIELLKARNLAIEHLVFIGHNPETEEIIHELSGIERSFKIPEAASVDPAFIRQQADRLLAYLGDQ